jgi:hypothetical protein
MTSPSPTPDSYPYQNEPIWSRSEKAIARKAFDAALGQELHEVIQEAKKMASRIQQPSDLWDLEYYLTQRRKEIDRLSWFATYRCVGETLVRKSTRRGRSARIAGREDEINPFFRSVSQRRRSLICI